MNRDRTHYHLQYHDGADGRRDGMDAASRAALIAPFALARARQSPEQLGAAVQVLQAAVMLHPSLAEALLLPTNLSDTDAPGSNKVAPACPLAQIKAAAPSSSSTSPSSS